MSHRTPSPRLFVGSCCREIPMQVNERICCIQRLATTITNLNHPPLSSLIYTTELLSAQPLNAIHLHYFYFVWDRTWTHCVKWIKGWTLDSLEVNLLLTWTFYVSLSRLLLCFMYIFLAFLQSISYNSHLFSKLMEMFPLVFYVSVLCMRACMCAT